MTKTFNSTLSILNHLEKKANDILIDIGQLKKHLEKNDAFSEQHNEKIKRPDGRLTDFGISAIYDEFYLGELLPTEISKKFKISKSAVTQRYNIWKNKN